MSDEKMKDEFIAWCKTRDVNPHKLKGTGQFIGAEVQSAWMGWQAAISQQPVKPSCEPVRIEFGKGLIGVHTVMMSERKAIALTNLGVGKVGVPTLHPNGTACESIIVEMDFGNAESCQVLIDELSGLFQDRPSCEPMAWYLPDVKMVTTSEVERDRWLSAGHIVISLYPI